MQALVLGRQPQLSYAELVSLFGPGVRHYNDEIALLDASVDLSRLGGSLKTATVVAEFNRAVVLDELPELLAGLPELGAKLGGSKSPVGLSVYGVTVGERQLFRLGLELKKRLREAGFKVRIIPPAGPALTAAQILHNQVLEQGADIVVAVDRQRWLVALTGAVQDIEAYSSRDYQRPGRSAKVGMLPPKLAQIMINLAAPSPGATVLDPFCGTGVVLMEALLMGYSAVGGDLDPQILELARENLEWLAARHSISHWRLLPPADARQLELESSVDTIVSEGYLGPPLTAPPSKTELNSLETELGSLYVEALRNLHDNLKPGGSLCLTLPAWKTNNGYQRLDIIDQIQSLGYTLKRFESVDQDDLLYFRPGQMVARELVALTKIN